MHGRNEGSQCGKGTEMTRHACKGGHPAGSDPTVGENAIHPHLPSGPIWRTLLSIVVLSVPEDYSRAYGWKGLQGRNSRSLGPVLGDAGNDISGKQRPTV